MSNDRDKCLTEVSEQLSEHFSDFIIIGTPKDENDRVSVAFLGSFPEALELMEKAKASIKGSMS
jgi:hypothetical protein